MLNPSSLRTPTAFGSVPFTASCAPWKWVLFCIASHATYVTSLIFLGTEDNRLLSHSDFSPSLSPSAVIPEAMSELNVEIYMEGEHLFPFFTKNCFQPNGVALQDLSFTPAPMSPRNFVGVGSHFETTMHLPFPLRSGRTWLPLCSFCSAFTLHNTAKEKREEGTCQQKFIHIHLLSIFSWPWMIRGEYLLLAQSGHCRTSWILSIRKKRGNFL